MLPAFSRTYFLPTYHSPHLNLAVNRRCSPATNLLGSQAANQLDQHLSPVDDRQDQLPSPAASLLGSHRDTLQRSRTVNHHLILQLNHLANLPFNLQLSLQINLQLNLQQSLQLNHLDNHQLNQLDNHRDNLQSSPQHIPQL
jgi:hypothetical protein